MYKSETGKLSAKILGCIFVFFVLKQLLQATAELQTQNTQKCIHTVLNWSVDSQEN